MPSCEEVDGWNQRMGGYLQSLRKDGPVHKVVRGSDGFAIIRREAADAEAFNKLVRETVERSGGDFVAFPRSARGGYDRVDIIPFD